MKGRKRPKADMNYCRAKRRFNRINELKGRILVLRYVFSIVLLVCGGALAAEPLSIEQQEVWLDDEESGELGTAPHPVR